MQLPLQTFSTLVGNAVAAVQGSARQLLDVSVGSILRAILEANASLALWLQWLIVQVLQMTRAATSAGVDLDSWVGDFSLQRLPATAATGQVTFGRFVSSSTATIPAGTPVRTGDGAQTFQVVAEPANPAWQPVVNAYTLSPGSASVTVPVVAVTPGLAGNVQPGVVSLIAAAVPGVDTVINMAPLAGGSDAESDVALRSRFQLFMQTLSRATPLAIGAAVLSVQQGLTYVLMENMDADGSVRMGSFLVILDDGSGNPSSNLLSSVASAVERVRPVGTTFAVQRPVIVSVTVEMTITVAAVATHGLVAGNVARALTTVIDALPIAGTLSAARLIQVAFNADSSVVNVVNVTMNGSAADLDPGAGGVVKLAGLQVN